MHPFHQAVAWAAWSDQISDRSHQSPPKPSVFVYFSTSLVPTTSKSGRKSYIIIIIGSHWAGNASHRPQRHSPTRRLAGRRQALRPALRLRELLRAGAVRRAHHGDVLNIFQESRADTLQIVCHTRTTPRAQAPAAMPIPTPSQLPHARAQAACQHSHAGRMHHVNPLHVRALRLLACMRLITYRRKA